MDLLLHDIPDEVGRALRDRAEATGMTVAAVATTALARGLDVPATSLARELDAFGRLSDEDARAIEEAVAFIDRCGLMDQPEPID